MRSRYLRRGVVAAPGERHVQAAAVPYGGGLAVLIGFSITVISGLGLAALELRLSWFGPEFHETIAGALERGVVMSVILGAAGVMLVMGRVDDRSALPAGPRFLLQLACAGAVAATGLTVTLFSPSPVIHVVLTIVAIVFVTNAFNFIDNMDGLLGGVGLAAAAGIGALALLDGQWFVAGFALALAGALAGFLPYNRTPARLYLGDEGSMFVGFLVATLMVAHSFQSERADQGTTVFPFIVPLIVLSVPVADGLTVVVDRLRRGVSPWTPGLDHLSHRLCRAGFSRPGAALALVSMALISQAGAILVYGLEVPRLVAATPFVMGAGFAIRAALRRRSGEKS